MPLGKAATFAAPSCSGRQARPSDAVARRGGGYLLAPLALAAALLLGWVLVFPPTPDLAAQVYRVGLFRQIGFAVYDSHWYAGHHLPGYSLLFPPFGALLGVRAAGVVSVLGSTALFALLVRERWPGGARWAAVAFAVAASADVWQGRLAFAFGVTIGLAAVLLYSRGHRASAAVTAALAAAASPVAGFVLGVAALIGAAQARSVRPLAVLAVAPALVVVLLAALFPEGGTEPYPLLSLLATAAATIVFSTAVTGGGRRLGVIGPSYLLICFLCLLIPSPVGSNVERAGVLLGAPLLLAVRPRLGRLGAAALVVLALWIVWGPVRETVAVSGSAAASRGYYAPVERFLAGLGAPVRIEVPLTRSRWEAALLAPKVSLARGWEKQLDERYDGVLLGGLDAASYRRWLRREAVSYVALPDAQLDPTSVAEGRLIRGGLPYLRLVAAPAHWRIYAVLDPTPLVSGPATLSALGHDGFALRASGPGAIEVRLHDTRWWTVTSGNACVGAGPEGFTELHAYGAGPIVVAARFSLSRLFGSGSCRP